MTRTAAAALLAAGIALNAAAWLSARNRAADLPEPRVELEAVRLADWKRPDGTTAAVVYTDWRNAGPVPVRRVTATITALGSTGRLWQQAGVVIYDGPPVPPGAEYREPDAAGFVLPEVPGVNDAVVELTGAAG